jgi:folate-binding Fe-S cluster repair protein YgfZ
MSNQYALLTHRSIISISGTDCIQFLQGLTTQNITKIATGGDGLYTAFLASNGRILYDAFVYPTHNYGRTNFLIDVDSRILPDLMHHLKRYVLRKKVAIRTLEKQLFQIWGPETSTLWGSVPPIDTLPPSVPSGCLVPRDRFTEIGTKDSRNLGLGLRVLLGADQECIST